MKVFLTGGTGFVGREVLWRLREAGHEVVLHSRRPLADDVRKLAYCHQATISEVLLQDRERTAAVLRGCTAVVHLVGIIVERGPDTFQQVHEGATRAMVEAAKIAGVNRFVHMSALGTRPEARARYHQSKWHGEQFVRGSGLAWTIFRPSVIYGRDDGFVNLLTGVARWCPVIPVFGTGRNKLQPIAVEEVARAFAGALSNAGSVGQTYDLCGPEVFTMDQLWDVVLRVLGKRRGRLHVPMWLGRMQARLLEVTCRMWGRGSPLTVDQLRMLEEDNTGDGAAATRDFQLHHPGFEGAIARYLAAP